MNILIPHTWLKEHLKTDATPEEMQRILSLSGPSVERIHTIENEPVFDIEVTTNRMDMASVRGIAREAAVILTHDDKPSTMQTVSSYKPKKGEVVSSSEDLPINITNDTQLCPRIMGVFIDVSIGDSPAWMKKRLEQVGIRSLNNLIDITNYVMIEYGQPMHVFDADRLGDTMIIRESKKGETITTLDGKHHTLLGGDIVVDNGKGTLTDLIGIMGTENSVVAGNTKRVFLFSEHSNPKHIRKTSMSLAIRTNAAQLNEKMLDPNLVEDAFLRAIQLYEECAEGRVSSKILDDYARPVKEKTIEFTFALTKRYLGIELPEKKQLDILTQLGCVVKKKEDTLIVTIPTFRPDLEIPVDLVEEIARIYGYHNLPSVLMDSVIPTNYPEGQDFAMEHMIKQFLADVGLQEVYTYSAVSAQKAEESGKKVQDHLEILNPLTDEHVYMRQSLIPSLIEVLEQNRQRKNLSVFELARTYVPQDKDLPKEEMHVGIVIQDEYRKAKGIFETLLSRLYVSPTYTQLSNKDIPAFAQDGVEIHIGKETIGMLGITKNGATFIDLLLSKLILTAKKYPTYKSISQFTPIIEHITFTLIKGTQIGKVMEIIQKADERITSVEFLDMFKENATFSLTYEDKTKQLSSVDATEIRKALVANVKKESDGVLVGNV